MVNQIDINRKTYYDIEQFLKDSSFNVVEIKQSKCFADQYSILSNEKIYIKISIDKGLLGVEIASNQCNSDYYDLSLFYQLITESNSLNVKLEGNYIFDFVKKNIETISNLMTGKQLESSLKKLNEMTDKRIFEQFGNDIFE